MTTCAWMLTQEEGQVAYICAQAGHLYKPYESAQWEMPRFSK